MFHKSKTFLKRILVYFIIKIYLPSEYKVNTIYGDLEFIYLTFKRKNNLYYQANKHFSLTPKDFYYLKEYFYEKVEKYINFVKINVDLENSILRFEI